MGPFRELESERTVIRHFKNSDLESFLHYRSDPSVAKYQLWGPFSRKDAIEFIKKFSTEPQGQTNEWAGFAIELKGTETLLGDCALKILEGDHPQAEIGFNIDPQYQGQGLGTEAIRCLLDYLFDELGFHRVIAITDTANISAVQLLERLNMRREGHFLQNIWFKGQWGDEFHYGVLRNEWIHHRNK